MHYILSQQGSKVARLACNPSHHHPRWGVPTTATHVTLTSAGAKVPCARTAQKEPSTSLHCQLLHRPSRVAGGAVRED